jgi:hypothetical protein
MTENYEKRDTILSKNSNFIITKVSIIDKKLVFILNIVKEN